MVCDSRYPDRVGVNRFGLDDAPLSKGELMDGILCKYVSLRKREVNMA